MVNSPSLIILAGIKLTAAISRLVAEIFILLSNVSKRKFLKIGKVKFSEPIFPKIFKPSFKLDFKTTNSIYLFFIPIPTITIIYILVVVVVERLIFVDKLKNYNKQLNIFK